LIASADHRLQMLRLACEELSYLEIDSREIDREGPSYSYLTLEAIHKEHPDAQLLFVIGWDSLVSFTSWYRWRDILRSACLLVIGRDGDQGDLPIEMDLQVENWSKTALKSGKAVRLDFDETPISSTQVRKLLRQGLPAESYLKPEVCQYIQEQNIYQGN
jgi:nicotinate-nucleotide adenylyltransferase